MKKITKLFCFILSILILCQLFSITVYAYDDEEKPIKNRSLTITANVDPRLPATQKDVYIILHNSKFQKDVAITLFCANNYVATTKVYEGDYTLKSFMVTDDLKGYYTVVCDDFSVEKISESITITVGDPSYDGEIEYKDIIGGMIDREATNKLREERGVKPIDWDEVDRLIESGEWNLNSPQTITDIPTIPDNSDNPTKDPDTTTPSFTNPTVTDPTITDPTTDNSQENQQNSKNSKLLSIIFICILIVIFIVTFYIRKKKYSSIKDLK